MQKSSGAILEYVPRGEAVAKLLRFPPTLAEAIQQEAARGRRSFSAQVFLMLELAIKRGLTQPTGEDE
jgi:hypothetical protein